MSQTSFKEFIDRYEGKSMQEIETQKLVEASNFSSGVILKKHNDAIKHGRNVLRHKDTNRKLDALAKQLDAVAAIATMAAAISGKEDSLLGKVAQGSTLRGI